VTRLLPDDTKASCVVRDHHLRARRRPNLCAGVLLIWMGGECSSGINSTMPPHISIEMLWDALCYSEVYCHSLFWVLAFSGEDSVLGIS